MKRAREVLARLTKEAAGEEPACEKSEISEKRSVPWDQAEADALVAEAIRQFGAHGWPADAEARRELGRRMDAVDDAYVGRDLAGLRTAAAGLLT